MTNTKITKLRLLCTVHQLHRENGGKIKDNIVVPIKNIR